ncbi:MAG: Coenzyme F420 hydrogenase/dehydrogenase, beta subunit C-terminal domain [Bacteroidaceae bacterium]|nr:Coenzyme F420 hydrogenase/dehydrogenase, beta subunit C-terminal domain [Bacteroidaceae bacterium]
MLPEILNIDKECTGCSACASICAKKAITIGYNDEFFYRPQVNNDICVNCGLCEKVCPVLSPKQEKVSLDFTSYMIKADDPVLVKKSSSGGAFSLLADIVMQEGGVVYGARYNFEKERLEHCSTDECSIEELRKSKYIESYIGDTYIKIRKNIEEGRKVLFCGTPCQNAGLASYLKTRRTDSRNLITIEFICHGVPSNKFFTEYKHYIEKKYGAKLTHVNFRPKNLGWREPNFQLTFANDKIIDINYKQSYYYRDVL